MIPFYGIGKNKTDKPSGINVSRAKKWGPSYPAEKDNKLGEKKTIMRNNESSSKTYPVRGLQEDKRRVTINP